MSHVLIYVTSLNMVNMHSHKSQALIRSFTMASQDEERPLLEDEQDEITPVKSYLTWKILASLSAIVLLSVGGAAYFGARTSQQPTRETFSNGTHEFKRTVILISIDGLRQVVPCLLRHILISTTARAISTVVSPPIY